MADDVISTQIMAQLLLGFYIGEFHLNHVLNVLNILLFKSSYWKKYTSSRILDGLKVIPFRS